MTTLTENVRLSTYLKGIVSGFLGTGSGVFPAAPSSLYFGLMTGEEVETSTYTGYARMSAAPPTYNVPTSTTHCALEIEGNDSFAAFTATKVLHSIGLFDASTGGNLLVWIPFPLTVQAGDELTLDTLVLNFNNNAAGSYSASNSCHFMSQMIARWVMNDMTNTDSAIGARFDEINSIAKTRRCMIVENTSDTTGVRWGYPTGGPPLIGSTGAAIVKHATQVNTDVSIETMPTTDGAPSETIQALTMAVGSQATWQMAASGSPSSGAVTKVTYAVVAQAPMSPPPNLIAGELSDDSDNVFIPLAVWTPSGTAWNFVEATTKLAWSLGMSLDRDLAQTPSPTYPGDLTGITTVNPKSLVKSGGYAYEHSLVSNRLSTLTYSVSTIFTEIINDNLDTFPGYAEPIDITLYNPDPVYEIVEMRRAVADVRSGDSHVAFSFRLRTADGDIPSVEGKAIVVRYSVNGAATQEVRGSAQADYTTSGRVLFALPAAALADPGQVRAELVLEGAGGSTQTYPFDDTIFISVMKSL